MKQKTKKKGEKQKKKKTQQQPQQQEQDEETKATQFCTGCEKTCTVDLRSAVISGQCVWMHEPEGLTPLSHTVSLPCPGGRPGHLLSRPAPLPISARGFSFFQCSNTR